MTAADQRQAPARTYYGAIDGLRGVTILSILVYHTGLYENGLFGVDMFFVLSGFLITLMLLREFGRNGRISLRRFYVRRAKRLLVPLVVTLAGTALMVLAWGRYEEVERAGQQGLASLFYVANWEQIYQGEAYWSSFGVPGPLAHMWSLAVTEQFYLVWPPLLLAVTLLARRRLVLWLGVATTVLFLVASLVPIMSYDGTNADRLYLGTDSHGMGFLAGGLAALILALVHGHVNRAGAERQHRQVPGWVLNVSAVVLVASIVVLSIRTSSYHEPWLYQGGFSVIALLGAALTLTLVRDDTVIGRIFSAKPLVEIGKISYALFLVHVPIFWAVQKNATDPSPTSLLLYGVPLSVAVAAFLHHIVSEPARIRRWNLTGRSVVSVLMAGVVAGWVALPSMAQTTAGDGDVAVLTLGDSLSHDFSDALATYYPDHFTVTDGGLGGCGVASPELTRTPRSGELDVPNGCLPWEERWRDWIQTAEPDVIVINLAWDGVEQLVDGSWLGACDDAYRDHYRERLQVMSDLAAPPLGERSVLVTNSRVDTPVNSAAEARCHSVLIEEFVEGQDRIDLLDLNGFVCDDDAGTCHETTPDGALMYSDKVHFTESGKQHISTWLATAVSAAAGVDPPGEPGGALVRRAPTRPPAATVAAIADVIGVREGEVCDDTPISEFDTVDAAFEADRTGYFVCGGARWRVQIHTYADDALAHHAAKSLIEQLGDAGWVNVETGDAARRVRYDADSGRVIGMLRTNFNVTVVERTTDAGLDVADVKTTPAIKRLDGVWAELEATQTKAGARAPEPP
ncbi:acyltransferase family protein [Phytoactinopolyspora limicola]|uniref:acyltransferase family protein n=1 Tax=Phytoactinopolyspora limicola TaxID=2715536 RepID=UPI00140C2C4F|nr:acyltransferase family protein [Phytoactinopolyspora limicola]